MDIKRIVVGAVAVCAAVGTCAQGAKLPKHLLELQSKEPGSIEARRAWTEHFYSQTRAQTNQPRVIYGADDRIEVWEETDPNLIAMAEAACVVVTTSEVTDNGDGTYTINSTPWTSQSGQALCPGEPFAGQPQVGNCSAWFVGGDLIVTAGHCIDSGDIGTWGYLFNFEIDTSGGSAPTIVPADDVYWITEIVDRELGGGFDHCVTRVDRPVVGRNPVPIMRGTAPAVGTPMTVIGHPTVLPKKIAGGADVKAVDGPDTFFQSNLDTYGGNSGSMVINMNTYEVAGILVRGAPDFEDGGGCTQSNMVPDTGNTGGGLTFEEVSLTTRFESFIPELGASLSPAGDNLSFGVVGGPFTNDSVLYTISNPTGDPLDYTVSLNDPQGLLLLDGGTGPVMGNLAGGADTTVTISLDASVNGLAAGVYAGDIVVDDTTNALQSTRTHTVEIGQTLVSTTPANGLTTGGPVGGPFSATEVYTLTSERPTPVMVQVTADQPWISINGGASDTISLGGTGTSDTVTIGIDASANALAAGLYNGTVTFENLDNNDTVTRDVTLDVGRFLYAATDTPIAISDNNSFVSTVTVGDAFCVGDVDVDIDISHTFIGDLAITLTSPNGTVVTLHNRTGGTTDDLMERYDDDGTGILPDGPGTLADFENEGSAGVWTLGVSDNAGGDTGTLNSWELRVASAGAACPPDAFDSSEGGAANQILSIVLGGQSQLAQPLSYTIESLPTSGLLYDSANVAVTSAPTTLPDENVKYKPALDFVGADSFTFSVDDGQPSNTATVSVDIGGNQTIASFPLDSDPGWTTDGGWAFGVPLGSGGDPSSGLTGSNVYGYNLAGDYPNNLSPPEFLTTGAIDCSNATNVSLAFARWLGVEHSSFDFATIDVSNDNTNWTQVWVNPAGSGNSIDETAWSAQSVDISAVADNQATVYVRWGMGVTDGSVTFHGWNIDDVEFTGTLPATCAADLTTAGAGSGDPGFGVPDGQVTNADIQFYVNAFIAGDPIADLTTAGAGSGDPDFGVPDGQVTNADIQLYVNLFVTGCP